MIDQIFISKRKPEHPLRDQALQLMHGVKRIAPVVKTASESINQPDGLVRLAEQQSPCVGGHLATIEISDDTPAAGSSKIDLARATLCRHRGINLESGQLVLAKQVYPIRDPDAQSLGEKSRLALPLLGTAHAATPPINCKKAATPVEHAICEAPELVAMDREIAALYDRGMAAFPAEERHNLAQSQLAFLKQRGGCAWASHHSAHPGPAVSECVRDKMEIRLRALRKAIDRGSL